MFARPLFLQQKQAYFLNKLVEVKNLRADRLCAEITRQQQRDDITLNLLVTLYIFCYQLKTIPYKHPLTLQSLLHVFLSLLVVVPDSVSKTLNIESLHTILILLLPIVLLLHLHLLLLLILHHGCLIIIHLIIHIILSSFTLDWVLLIKLV